MIVTRTQNLFLMLLYICLFSAVSYPAEPKPTVLRISTFNIEDVRTQDLDTAEDPRLKQIAAIIQRIRPNVILLSEMTARIGQEESNADRFVRLYLSVPQADGLKPITFNTFTPYTNTGFHSGFDLDKSGFIDASPPEQTKVQTDAGRVYGNDCYGFGTFPGQYGMALLVDPRLNIQEENIRSFQNFLWKDLEDHSAPMNPDRTPWYTPDEWEVFRLASKTFADIPITLPNGQVLHALISHPTPPAFDGPERRNKLRNLDEIKLIRRYIDNDPKLYDDKAQQGGLAEDELFVILGDLNADPTDGSSLDRVIITQLLTSSKIADDVFPSSEIKVKGLDSTDTAHFRLRVDYVLPSDDIRILNSGVWRLPEADQEFPSDHFPVWIEALIPPSSD